MKFIIIFIGLFISLISNGQTESVVNAEDFKVNGVLGLSTNKTGLLKFIKKADKVKKTIPDCSYEEEYSKGIIFYDYLKGGMTYLVYKNKAEFEELNLENNPLQYLLYKDFKITNRTTIADLKKYFPKSVNNYLKDKIVIRLKFGKQLDDELQIELKNKKVTRVSYWTPC